MNFGDFIDNSVNRTGTMHPEISEIHIKKSYLKIFLFSIFYSIVLLACVAMGHSNSISWPWVSWIAALCIAGLLLRHLSFAFRAYELTINQRGLLFCQTFYDWKSIIEIERTKEVGAFLDSSWIILTIKCSNREKEHFERSEYVLRITPQILQKSQFDIYSLLRSFHQEFGVTEGSE